MPELRDPVGSGLSNYYEIDYSVNLRPDFLKDWSKEAACLGMWDLMDSVRKEAAAVCKGCPVRLECLADCMEYEKKVDAQANIRNDLDRYNHSNNNPNGHWRIGTRGGYKPSERQYIAFAIELGASVYDY